MDSLFEDFHRDSEDGLLRKCGVVEEFTNLLEQKFKPKYDRKLLKRFALCRTLFRMRAIARKMASDRDTLRAERKKLEFSYSSNKKIPKQTPSTSSQNSNKAKSSPKLLVFLKITNDKK